MYGSAQQSPYLQVALPLIEDVKGGEGLGSLWRVFTKCQGSIQDGSRLENISWRLWYKSLHPSTPTAAGPSGGHLRAMAHHDPPFGDRSRQPHHHGRRPSIAGSSFTESVASSSVESDLSDRDFFPPQSTLGVQESAVAAAVTDDAADEALAGGDSSRQGPTETRSEPITPSLPPLGPIVSSPTSSSAAITGAAGTSARRPTRPSISAVPQHASTGDLASIDGLASCSSNGSHHPHHQHGGPSTGADGGSSGPRPALTVRAKSTPRLKSSSPYETPAPKPLRPPPRPLDELGSAGISFGRVLGHVYKEGTVRSIARRPQQQQQQQQQQPSPPPPPPQAPPPPPPPTTVVSESVDDRPLPVGGPSPPRPSSNGRPVVAPMSSASSDGVRSSEPSARNSLSSSGGHGHFLGYGGRGGSAGGGPSIRVLEPTPANTTPSSPAPRGHATLWGTDEDGDALGAGALDGFSFTQSYGEGSQERTPRPGLGALNEAPSTSDFAATASSLELVARSPLSTSSSDTLGSMTSSALTLNLPGERQRAPQDPHQRPIPPAGRAGGHVNPPGSTPAAEGKKLFFISPDNGEGSGSCSSLDSDSARPSPPPPASPKASTSIDVGEQRIGSPESLEDGGLQMRRRAKSPMRATSPGRGSRAVAAPTSSGSPPRPVVSPSYAPLASSPLKQTSLPPRTPAPPPAVGCLPDSPATAAAAAAAGGWVSDDDGDEDEAEGPQRPKPPVRQQSTSSTTSSAGRRKGSTGSAKAGSASSKAPAGRRKSAPSRPASAAMVMTKSNEGVAKTNGAMAPPPALTRGAASEPLVPAPTVRRASAGPTPTATGTGGRFAQEQAKAASVIAAATNVNGPPAPREKLVSTGPALAPPSAKASGSGSSRNAASGPTRPSLNGRRSSSSKLTMTTSRAKAAPPATAADVEDDDGSGSYETDSGGETAAGSGGDGEWASDSQSSGAASPAVGGGGGKSTKAPVPAVTPAAATLAPPGRRSSAAAAARSKATRYTAAAVERARQEAAARFAEEEVERQKSLFRKVPVSKSAADLYGLGREALAMSSPAVPARAETVGSGTTSTGNIAGGRSSGLLSDMFKSEREKREGVYHQRAGHQSSQDLWQHGRDAAAAASSSRTPAAMLPRNKSAAALPQASGFTVGRGEDLESESETDTPGSGDNKITIGSSEAQRRLAVLSAKTPATTTPRHHGLSAMTAMTPVGAAADTTEPHQQHMNYPPTTRPLPPRPDAAPVVESPQPLEDDSTLPPLAAAPQSPRTTRRQMLAAELPEELRKQLLWERMSRQRVYGGGTINRSNSTPKLTAEALAQERPGVQRNAATESAPASRAPSDSSSPPPQAPPPPLKRNSGILGGGGLLRPLTSSAGLSPPAATQNGQRERSSSDAPAPNTGGGGGQPANPYLEKVKASRKSTEGPLQAYRSGPSATNLARLNAQHPPSSESSSDSDDEEDALTLLKRRNTHHGELSKLGNDGWDADYRSHGF